MVKINKIYTRTGDDGTTGLVGGDRAAKDCKRVSAFGEIDELNAWIGLLRTHAKASNNDALETRLEIIQNELFDLGAELATPAAKLTDSLKKISKSDCTQLELWIDEAVSGLPELRSFVLPGGTEMNSYLHIARAICRRAERSIVSLNHEEKVRDEIMVYINRLSDLLFAFARRESFKSKTPEFLWEHGKRKIV